MWGLYVSDHDREPAPSFWRFVFDVALGGLRRRIKALEDENEKLGARIDELERKVVRQGEELTMLAALVPAAVRRLNEAERSSSTTLLH